MNTFTDWNLRLLQTFFHRASAGTEVWLATTPEELDIIGHDLGGDDGFVDCVREGPRWPTVRVSGNRFGRGEARDFFSRCEALASQRGKPLFRPPEYVDPGTLDPDYNGLDAPTYLPFLAALVRAAARMGGAGFYAQLAADLGVTGAGWGSNQMGGLVDAVWGDLEYWTDKHSDLVGQFRCRTIGGFPLIGLPKAQIILTRQDHERLPRLFARLGWNPGQEVGLGQLRQLEGQSTGNQLAFMSTGFVEACEKASGAFADPLKTLLERALRDWDGFDAVARETSGTQSQSREASIALLFRQTDDQPPGWTLAPMIPREDLIEGDKLGWRDMVWPLFDGSPTWRLGVSEAVDGETLLESSATSSVSLSLIETEDLNGDVAGTAAYRLGQATARYFVRDDWSPLPDGYHALLVERTVLPSAAAFFILNRVTHGVDTVRVVLANNGVSYTELPVAGLPASWSLLRVDEASTIGAARQELPGPWESTSRAPRRIRLVGGLRVLRGGSWYYLDHSLPFLEVDAPGELTPTGAGVLLTEARVGSHTSRLEAQNLFGCTKTIRLYAIELSSSESHHSSIYLKDTEGHQVESVTLRVLGDVLAPAVGQGVFRMNEIGAPERDGDLGITGPRVVPDTESLLPSIPFVLANPGHPARADRLEVAMTSVAARFLELVSYRGHMATSRARDSIRALAAVGATRHAIRPDDLLRALWIAGHIEIETDLKGRWTRVHAVPPTLYTIPVLTTVGAQVSCIAGTLSRTHWNRLMLAHHERIHIWFSDSPELGIPVVRVSGDDTNALRAIAEQLGFAFVERAAAKAAEWAGDLNKIQAQWREGGRETAPRGFLDGAEYFWAHKGHFGSKRLEFSTGVDLLRGIDPETNSSRLHMLELQGEHGDKLFSFVRDQWWARWYALGALTRFLAAFEENGAWPVHYTGQTGSVWLPGRLSLPVVLARTLVLCSGSLPVAHRVVRGPHQDRLEVVSRNGIHLLTANPVYEGMVPPSPQESVWLEYRWVPQPVAIEIAKKLGAAIVPA